MMDYDEIDHDLKFWITYNLRRRSLFLGATMISGCKGHILIWDFDSGRVRSHIDIPKTLTKRVGKRGRLMQKNALIWAVELLSDGTIVSGDSEGTLSFWDVGTATLKTQFKTHDGPILALCVSRDGRVCGTLIFIS